MKKYLWFILLAVCISAGAQNTIPDAAEYADPIVQMSGRAYTFGLASNKQSNIRPIVLCFTTDIHGDYENMTRIVNFCDQYKDYIDDILHGGDNTRGGSNNYTWFAKIPGAEKVLNCIGNHDTDIFNAEGKSIGKETTKTVYDKFFGPFIKNWNVQQPKDADKLGLSYYYKDYKEGNVRLITLDVMYYDERQDKWLNETLADAIKRGLHVVMLEHYPIASKPIKSNFTSYTFIEEDTVGNDLNPLAVVAVDKFIEKGGNFVCWLAGHTHKNCISYMPEHHNQMLIMQEPATYDSKQNAWGDTYRTKGTKSQDSFDIIAIDVYSKILRILRIGNEYDMRLRHKKTVTIKYDSHEILAEY